MDFEFNEEHQAVKEAALNFAKTELLQEVIARDIKGVFPKDLVKKMADMGFMGMMVSTKYEGGGMDTLSYVIALEEIARIDASAAVIMSVNNSLVCWGLEKYGTEAQKNKYLKALASGRSLGAFALSEPEAGSDATRQKTTAVDKGDHYLINGTKNWITNGHSAEIFLIIAQTDKEKEHHGISVFIVEKGWEGFEVGVKEDKMGIRASDTSSLMFNNLKVPKENRIGEEGLGFRFAMETLDGGRIGIAAQALGIAAGALELSVKYAKERKAFGKPISKHQAIQFKLADMDTEVEAARLLCYKAASEKDKNEDYSKWSAMAKLYSSKVAMRTTTEAVQIHGGYGYVREYHVERMMRDAKITEIYEGTSEIQKIVISRKLLS